MRASMRRTSRTQRTHEMTKTQRTLQQRLQQCRVKRERMHTQFVIPRSNNSQSIRERRGGKGNRMLPVLEINGMLPVWEIIRILPVFCALPVFSLCSPCAPTRPHNYAIIASHLQLQTIDAICWSHRAPPSPERLNWQTFFTNHVFFCHRTRVCLPLVAIWWRPVATRVADFFITKLWIQKTLGIQWSSGHISDTQRTYFHRCLRNPSIGRPFCLYVLPLVAGSGGDRLPQIRH